jgi:hypothetical protein
MKEYHDLIYFGDMWENDKESRECKKDVMGKMKEAFPNLVEENADCDIKGYRSSITIPELEDKVFFRWMILNKFWNLSLTMQLNVMQGTPEIKEVIDELKKEGLI